MTDLEKFQAVNVCETTEALKKAIISFADSNGEIQGRRKTFNADRMANKVDGVVNKQLSPNNLTREFGIRQQALYLSYYENP